MNNKRLEDLLAKESFVLWLKGESAPEEEEYWDAWLQEHPERRVLVEEAREIMLAFDREYEAPDPKQELEKLNTLIDRNQHVELQFPDQHHAPFYREMMGPVAAGIVILIIAIGSIFAYQAYPLLSAEAMEQEEVAQKTPVKEYNTDFGEKLTFRLSDGSSIVLNANSNLKFSSKIEKGLNTEVWLQGEAYFDIAHLEGDQQRTFTVHTANGSIHVLGTRFAVNTFREQTQTVLEEGKIRVQVKDELADQKTEYMLEPGERAQFRAFDNKIAVQDVNTSVYTSWTEDKLIFENTPMEDVATRIEDTFGIEVVVDEAYANEILSGSIKSDNLDVLTEALKKILDANINNRDGNLHIGG
ncbi:FecR domain-containing protein [Aliifodinibius sp. S!AR15-10]|uniref:FecR domain-containing protein n=1 Tax=Aliifodinibius sp. S!AR15-10 TaxID=2950437 RepID=UPI00285CCD08|nr:FecR domain-containing protein [Aliifodinibius sp. S!AR15-10]MDR8394081.1 FecR domain-containing protein [Aliifodinibius sp. S!AR15-10]